MEKQVKISVITLGDKGVGKTSIIKRIHDDSFQEIMLSTIGIDDFFIERNYTKRNIKIALCFKDTAGQELYKKIPLQYIRKSDIVLLVFSTIETLNTIRERWYNFYKENANLEKSKFILVGNKSDIFGDESEEIERQGQEFSEEINAHFITCSAKSKDNIDTLEQIIIDEAKRMIDLKEELLNEQNRIQLNNNQGRNNGNQRRNGCC